MQMAQVQESGTSQNGITPKNGMLCLRWLSEKEPPLASNLTQKSDKNLVPVAIHRLHPAAIDHPQ